MTYPDFSNQVILEMQLTPEEQDQFMELVVANLASVATQKFLESPHTRHCEKIELEKELVEFESSYDTQKEKASPRILRAMERYFRLTAKDLESQQSKQNKK